MWILGGPTITDGVIYIGSSYQHVIRAYNASNGKVIWQTNVDYRVNDKPLVLDDFVIIGTEHDTDVKLGTICVLDKTTGKIISRISAGGQVYSSPLSYNDLIYYGCTDGNIYALDKEKITNVPVINLKGTMIMRVGQIYDTGSLDTSLYVYNNGLAEDSITVTTTMDEVSAEPIVFKLAAKDSQKVNIKVTPASLTPKKYSCTLSFKSERSLPPVTVNRSV